MFSNFYRLELHNEACVAIANLRGRMSKNRIEIQDFCDFQISELEFEMQNLEDVKVKMIFSL